MEGKTYKLWYTDEYKKSIEALWRPIKDTRSMNHRKSNDLHTIWEKALKAYNEEREFWSLIKKNLYPRG